MSARTAEVNISLMREMLEKYLPEASADVKTKLLRYYELLVEWNARINLTAITDPEGVAARHFADSVLGARFVPENARLIDVGTGAGFPGIPLKLVRPDIELTLLDSLNKRLIFLREVIKELGIGAELVHMRAEDAGRDPVYREKFDAATSRAVAGTDRIAEWTLPLIKVKGISLMYKGPGAEEELKTAAGVVKDLRAAAKIEGFSTPWGERNIIIAEKYAETPKKYPRKPGKNK